MSDQDKNEISRRDLFAKIGMLLNGLAVVILAMPVVGYLVSPILGGDRGQYKRWITLGELDEFPEGQTRLAKFQNPISGVADGETDRIPCWVRRVQGEQFQVFAVNCAHLGCPVRWFAQSGLFMCPVSWRRVLPGRLARLRTAAARTVRVSLQSGRRQVADRSRTTADVVHHREPGCEEERMSRLEEDRATGSTRDCRSAVSSAKR